MLDNEAVIEKSAALKAAGIPFSLVTVVRCESSTSVKPGAKAIVEADGIIQGWVGGGCTQPAVIKVSKQALFDGQSRLIRISPTRKAAVDAGIVDFVSTCHSAGTMDIFIDPVVQRPTLLIIGVSPVAQSLCSFAHQAGFKVVVAFPNIGRELFPDASHTIDNLQSDDLLANANQFIVVTSQGNQDEAALKAALKGTTDYIAFVASRRKATKLRQLLQDQGYDKTRIERILSPAGIDIGAVTPPEIALSILAEIIRARRCIDVDSIDVDSIDVSRAERINSPDSRSLPTDGSDAIVPTSSVTNANSCCSGVN